MTAVPAPRFVGAHVRRLIDSRLPQGQARSVDDLQLPGLLHLAFMRSPHSHARLAGIDVGPALVDALSGRLRLAPPTSATTETITEKRVTDQATIRTTDITTTQGTG